MFYTGINDYSNDVYFDEEAIKPSIYGDFVEGAFNAMAENEANYNKLIESIGLMESAMYEEEGDVVYTEGMISSVWESLKKFVIKVWQKIVALFKRFVAMFDQYFAKDKDFIKKYRSQIARSDVKDLDFDGYTFKNLDTAINNMKIDAVNAEISGINDKTDDYKDQFTDGSVRSKYNDKKETGDQVDDALDSYRGKLLGTSKVDASDFADELKEYLYGSTSPESLDEKDMDLMEQIRIIERAHDRIKDAEKFKSRVEKMFKLILKKIDDLKGDQAKAHGMQTVFKKKDTDPKDLTPAERERYDDTYNTYSKYSGYTSKVVHGISSIVSQACGMVLNALKDQNRQARAICVKAMVKSKQFNHESADMGFEYPAYGESFLSDIEFK